MGFDTLYMAAAVASLMPIDYVLINECNRVNASKDKCFHYIGNDENGAL